MAQLADLSIGQTARVAGLDGCSVFYRQKLMAMGLTRGARFQLVRKAPFGDPIEILVRGCHLSLRKSEAEGLYVEEA